MIILFTYFVFVSFLQIVPPNKKIWESGDDGKGDISFLSNQWAPSNAWGNAPSGKMHSHIYPSCSVSRERILIGLIFLLLFLSMQYFTHPDSFDWLYRSFSAVPPR